MREFKEADYKVFAMFEKQWALVTAGSAEHFNSCTIGWGSLSTIWRRSTVTVYVHPARYTSEFLTQSDTFTVSFFPEEYRSALSYMGSHSGRNGDKAAASGLTPVSIGDSVTYAEAELTFLCKKLYQHSFAAEDLSPEIREYYAAGARSFPDFQGGWQPHLVFVGEIIGVEDKRK